MYRFNGLPEGVFVKNKFSDRNPDALWACWAMTETALIEALHSQPGFKGTAAFWYMCSMIYGPCAPNYLLSTRRAYEDQFTGYIIRRIFQDMQETQT